MLLHKKRSNKQEDNITQMVAVRRQNSVISNTMIKVSTLSFNTSSQSLLKLFTALSIRPQTQTVTDHLHHFLEFNDHLQLWITNVIGLQHCPLAMVM